jgi:hypothetical protein
LYSGIQFSKVADIPFDLFILSPSGMKKSRFSRDNQTTVKLLLIAALWIG